MNAAAQAGCTTTSAVAVTQSAVAARLKCDAGNATTIGRQMTLTTKNCNLTSSRPQEWRIMPICWRMQVRAALRRLAEGERNDHEGAV